jgi:hypothetical protein
MELTGVLDTDLDMHVPYTVSAKSQPKGTVTTRNVGFQMTSSNLVVAKGNLNLALSGRSPLLKS